MALVRLRATRRSRVDGGDCAPAQLTDEGVRPMGNEPPESLRDRQRSFVRGEIFDAALRLFAERGYDAVKTEDIAAAAGVSLTTYVRYTPSNEGLLLEPLRSGGRAIVARLQQRPPSESAPVALSRAILGRSTEFDDERLKLWRAGISSAPDLLERVSLITADDRITLTKLVADRMSVDVTDDSRPGLLVHVMLAAAEFAYSQWLSDADGDATSWTERVEFALTTVRTGRWK
jgi:AcrR family transcriptional regulator